MTSNILSFTACPIRLTAQSPLSSLTGHPNFSRNNITVRRYVRDPQRNRRRHVTVVNAISTRQSKSKSQSRSQPNSPPVPPASSDSTTTQAELLRNYTSTPLYDVIIIGAGPAGLSLAAALGLQKMSVCCLDRTLNRAWPNHYGVWRDEFEQVGFEDCATADYDTTVVHAGSGLSDKIQLDRSYIRVDRVKLKARLVDQCHENGVTFIQHNVSRVDHVCAHWSAVFLEKSSPASHEDTDNNYGEVEEANKLAYTGMLRARLIVDCTGHAVAFTNVDEIQAEKSQIWYQAAYGIEAEVTSYPYDKDKMLLMDFRDDHMSNSFRQASERQPTFLYVFPVHDRRAFFEETSVIQREAVDFEELKARLYRRLKHDGVEVLRVIEEERSLIPMGGQLPDRSQRVVAFGGAALLVHPATGYMVGRTVRLAHRLAERMKRGLDHVGTQQDVSEVVKDCWDELWGVNARRQRDFLVFGAELLESLGMTESRAFFRAFFKLPRHLWVRFLSYDLDGPLLRAQFAFTFFLVADNAIRLRLLSAMVQYGKWRLIRSVMPEWMTSFTE